MRNGFFIKLAFSNIRRNKDVFKPYIMASLFMVFVFYVFLMLNNNGPAIGFSDFKAFVFIMSIGVIVSMVFSVIFIFYANSFIIKRRKKELGLYGVLGLEKRHIAILMACETLITGVISIVAGIVLGLVFKKLSILILAKLMHTYARLDRVFDASAIIYTVLFFAAVFFLVLIYNLFQVSLSRPVDLLKSESKGENEPKGMVIVTLLGTLLLLVGYIMAQIMRGFELIFLLALPTVMLVIVATYMLFMSGSIFVLKQLRKRKNIYYKPDNFISISGLMHRMKQNSVGLASICILCTMVIITLSTTFCMWSGIETSLKKTSSDDIYVNNMPLGYKTAMEAAVHKYSKEYDILIDDFYILREYSFQGNIDQEGFITSAWKASEDGMGYNLSDYINFYFVTADEYETVTGEQMLLKTDETVMIFDPEVLQSSGMNIDYETLSYISKGMTLKIHEDISDLWTSEGCKLGAIDELLKVIDVRHEDKFLKGKYGNRHNVYMIVANEDVAKACSSSVRQSEERYMAVVNYSGHGDSRQSFMNRVNDAIYASGYAANMNSLDLAKDMYYSVYGGLLFVGSFLSILFLMAMVIIIYYKQMSEGLEDRERYHILLKVGIDEADIRATINKQVKSIFLIPLVVAVVHTAAAFKMMGYLVSMNTLIETGSYGLFGLCTIIISGVIAIIYLLVYKVTARAYYRFIY